jgi:hypothetical protein
MKAEFIKFNKGENWVSGTIDKYQFEAKIFDEGSTYGINNSRVSKLSIYDEKVRQEKSNFFAACIVNYDRGWDIKPKKKHMEYFNAVMELLENAPKLLKKNPDYKPLTGYEKYSQPFHYEVYDYDGTILFKSDIVKTNFEYSNDRHREFFNHMEEIEKIAMEQCTRWLNENYPDWESDLAYWD